MLPPKSSSRARASERRKVHKQHRQTPAMPRPAMPHAKQRLVTTPTHAPHQRQRKATWDMSCVVQVRPLWEAPLLSCACSMCGQPMKIATMTAAVSCQLLLLSFFRHSHPHPSSSAVPHCSEHTAPTPQHPLFFERSINVWPQLW